MVGGARWHTDEVACTMVGETSRVCHLNPCIKTCKGLFEGVEKTYTCIIARFGSAPAAKTGPS